MCAKISEDMILLLVDISVYLCGLWLPPVAVRADPDLASGPAFFRTYSSWYCSMHAQI